MNVRAIAAAAAACLVAGGAAAMTAQEYKTQRSRIQDQFATAKERCTSVTGHARDICEVQARAAYDVARTELRARHKPTPANREKARIAKADATFNVARAKCGDLNGTAQDVCVEDARTRLGSAKAEAHASRKEDERILQAQKGRLQ